MTTIVKVAVQVVIDRSQCKTNCQW